jgi:hypothetical protein
VWLRTVGQENDRQLTADSKRGIRFFFWTYSLHQLIYAQDSDGDENWHLYLVNIQSNIVRDLTPFQGVRAQVINLDHNFPDEMLVGMNLRNPQIFDVYHVNLTNGAVELHTENPGNIVSWTADAEFNIRAATASTPDGDLIYYTEKFLHTHGRPCGTGVLMKKEMLSYFLMIVKPSTLLAIMMPMLSN